MNSTLILVRRYKNSPPIGTIAKFEYTSIIGYWWKQIGVPYEIVRKPSSYFKKRSKCWKNLVEITNKKDGWHIPTKQDQKELNNYLKISKMEKDLERLETNIENSASQYIGKGITDDIDDKDRITVNAFISGAHSSAAKEYWQRKELNKQN